MVHTTINVMQSAEYRLCDNRAVGLPSSNLENCRIAGRTLTKRSMRTPALEICDIGRNGSTQLVVGEDDQTHASIPPLVGLTAFPALAGCDAKLTRDIPGALPSIWVRACRPTSPASGATKANALRPANCSRRSTAGSSDLRLVHGGLRYARPEGGQDPAQRADAMSGPLRGAEAYKAPAGPVGMRSRIRRDGRSSYWRRRRSILGHYVKLYVVVRCKRFFCRPGR